MKQKEQVITTFTNESFDGLRRQGASEEEVQRYRAKYLNYKPGDHYSIDAGAPGIGKSVYLITRIENETIYGVYLPNESTVRILEPWECE